jgi:hypothetical protein
MSFHNTHFKDIKMELLSKITAKTLAGDVKKAPEGNLYQIVGNASKIESGEHATFGTFYALVGDFIATRETGEVYRSGKAFVPDIVLNLVKPFLDDEKPVQIAFRVGKKLDESAPAGYVYTVENLIEPKEDPLLALAMGFHESQIKLAPVKEEAVKETAKKK